MNLWILTEERPKNEVLRAIFIWFAREQNCGFFGDKIRIIPLLNEERSFSFTYEVIGFKCAKVDRVFIKTISGNSSFTDFLIFYQEKQPVVSDTPIGAIEETKTDDSESRNTGVYQRCSKFVYIRYFYPRTKLVMLYSLRVKQKPFPTLTNIFGTRMLLTLDVEIIGKSLDTEIFKPFASIDEMIAFKGEIHAPRGTNVQIAITKVSDSLIQISGRLVKGDSLAHDPNIGALTVIAATLRKLGWEGRIVITRHGLRQQHIKRGNKFVRIANNIGIELEGLTLPRVPELTDYWHYELKGEKLGTIFIHICVENFTTGFSIFENHAGCEKGYFMTDKGEYIPLAKYSDRDAYKAGDKSAIIFIPDLVLLDIDETEVVTVEGKTYQNRAKGIEELNNYGSFDRYYLKVYYPDFKVVKTVVLYGGNKECIVELKVGFLLNENGRLVLGLQAPKIFVKAITNLFSYWGVKTGR